MQEVDLSAAQFNLAGAKKASLTMRGVYSAGLTAVHLDEEPANFLEKKLALEPYIQKLSDFEDPDSIAEFLVQEEIKASRGHAQSCALAKYLTRESGEPVQVGRTATSLPKHVRMRHDDHTDVTYVLEVEHPTFDHTDAMKQFVKEFDNGNYPDLEA